MPQKPEKEQLQQIVDEIKEEIYSSARLLEIELKKEDRKEQSNKLIKGEGEERTKRGCFWEMFVN